MAIVFFVKTKIYRGTDPQTHELKIVEQQVGAPLIVVRELVRANAFTTFEVILIQVTLYALISIKGQRSWNSSVHL